MNSLVITNEKATFGIHVYGQDIYVELSDELNTEIRARFEEVCQEQNCHNDFMNQLEVERHFPYYGEYMKSSYSVHKIDSHPYLSQSLITKIKEEVKEKAKIEIIAGLDNLLANPKQIIRARVVYDENGRTFEDIKRQIQLNVLEEEYRCKNKSVSIFNPKFSFSSIEEDCGDIEISWNFDYPINIINWIGFDDGEGLVEFVNQNSTKQFKDSSEFYITSFTIIKGTFANRLRTLEQFFLNNIEIRIKDSGSHSKEILLIVDLRNLSDEETLNVGSEIARIIHD